MRKVDEKRKGKNGEDVWVNRGMVRIQIDVYPIENAEQNKVGAGREEPNENPFLPMPVGRLALSLNPFAMISQLFGGAFACKLYMFIALLLFCALTIAMLPMIISNLVSNSIANLFGLG